MEYNFSDPEVEVGTWKNARGMPFRNFNCKKCKFSTIFPEKMREHLIMEDHRWPFTTAVQQIPDEHGFYDPTFV